MAIPSPRLGGRPPSSWRRRGRVAALSLVVVAVVGAPAPLAAQTPAPGLVVSDRPGGDALDAPLEVTVPADGEGVTRTLFLRAVPAGSGGPVSLLVDADGAASLQLASGGDVGTVVDVDLVDGQVPLRVTVASDRAGESDAVVVARSGNGPWTDLLTVRAARPPGPVVVGGAADGGVAVTSRSGRFGLDLELFAGEAGLADLRATVQPFRDEGGELFPAEATIRPAGEGAEAGAGTREPVDVAADGHAVLHLAAGLPFGATYRTTVRLAHDGVVDPPLAVEVTRAQHATTIAVTDATVERVAAGSGQPATVRHHVSVSETAGQDTVVAVPGLLLHTRGEDAVGADDARVTHVWDETPGHERVDLLAAGDGASFTVPGFGTVRLLVEMELPSAAASNEVTLRYAQDGAPPLDREYTVTVRRPWWWPLACIAAGLGVSLLLRTLWRRWRGRYVLVLPLSRLDRDVARLRGVLGVRGEGEARVFDGLAGSIRRVAAEAEGEDREAVEASTKLLEGRVAALPAWVELSRRVEGSPLRDVAAAFRERVAALGAVLAGDRQPTAPGAPIDAVAALSAAWDDAVAAALRAEVARSRDQIVTALGPELARVPGAILDDAERLAAAHQPHGAVTRTQEARQTAAEVLAAQVAAELQPRAVLAVPPGEWARLTAGVAALLHQRPRTLPDVDAAAKQLLHVVADLAEARAAGHPEIATAVQRARTAIPATPALARKDLYAALEQLAAALAPPALGGGGVGAGSTPPVADAAAVAAATGTLAVLQPERRDPPVAMALPTPAELRRRLFRLELAATVIAGAVALAVGLEFLYADDHTWGTLGDAVAAFAWGLGIQSLTGQSITGIPALRDAIVGV